MQSTLEESEWSILSLFLETYLLDIVSSIAWILPI
jgi:hypothetical protein